MIKINKLVTGEEIIADTTKNDDKTYTFKNPVRVMITHEGVGMGYFCPFSSSKEITIKQEHVVWVAELEDEMKNAYNAQFGNGIVVASSASAIDLS